MVVVVVYNPVVDISLSFSSSDAFFTSLVASAKMIETIITSSCLCLFTSDNIGDSTKKGLKNPPFLAHHCNCCHVTIIINVVLQKVLKNVIMKLFTEMVIKVYL